MRGGRFADAQDQLSSSAPPRKAATRSASASVRTRLGALPNGSIVTTGRSVDQVVAAQAPREGLPPGELGGHGKDASEGVASAGR